jgi:DNA-binding GntR family transcriptional regulator
MLRQSSEGAHASAIVPPVQRRTVTEEVLDRLRDLLLRGVLRPGARIDQAELAASFGVSTVPVREALLRLQSAGLVQLIPHRGVFVAEVSVEELLDIYSTRELLEEQAARIAAGQLTAADVDALEHLATGMQTAARDQRLDELLTLNREFHFTIYRASKRRHLLQLIEQLWDLSTRYAHLQLHTVPGRASEALHEIRSIVAACRGRDADALALMIRYKVHQTTAGLLQHTNLPEKATAAEAVESTPAPPASGKKPKTPAAGVAAAPPTAKGAPAKASKARSKSSTKAAVPKASKSPSKPARKTAAPAADKARGKATGKAVVRRSKAKDGRGA